MYFWKAKALARDLKENKVSEKEQMGYFLLTGIGFLPGNYSISWLESAIGITVFVLEPSGAFRPIGETTIKTLSLG